VAAALADDGRAIRLWIRDGNATRVEAVAFTPFLLAADEALVGDAAGLVALTRLEGAGDLRWLARFGAWSAALAARDRCREATGLQANAPEAPYRFFPDPVHQYLLMAGRTSFGGLRFGDLRRLALDIEVVTTEGYEFPSAAREGDRIVAIALADPVGFRHVLRGDRLDEPALLAECGRIIRERDPDVIEGHNVFRFDLEYIEARARRHGVALAWGRDGSPMRSRPARLSVAERTIGFRRYEIAGRHVVDTWMLAQLHDIGARDLPSFGLKDIARHLGVAAADRTYVDASNVARQLADDADRLMAYAGDDAVETLAISAILSPPYFAQARLVPFDYQSTTLRGTAAKVDALLLREYLRQGRAVPRPRPGQSVGGGLTAIWHQGVAAPVLHVDVTSLYPSLMIGGRVAPACDELGVFLDLLTHLRDVRVAAKRAAQAAASEEERQHQLALSQSFKILINSFYGYLGFSSAHWNDFEAANRVTADGRAIVTSIVERLRTLGATPVEADTDGVYFTPPPGHAPDDDARLLDGVAAKLPAGITLELDGRGADAQAVVDRWLGDFAAHRLDVRAFARTETLQESLEVYRERLTAGLRPAAAAYELAAASGRPVQPGDQISYYVAGRTARVAVNETAKLASLWDPARPDENVEYYQSKVLETWERFRRFTEQDGLVPYMDDAPESPQLSLF